MILVLVGIISLVECSWGHYYQDYYQYYHRNPYPSTQGCNHNHSPGGLASGYGAGDYHIYHHPITPTTRYGLGIDYNHYRPYNYGAYWYNNNYNNGATSFLGGVRHQSSSVNSIRNRNTYAGAYNWGQHPVLINNYTPTYRPPLVPAVTAVHSSNHHGLFGGVRTVHHSNTQAAFNRNQQQGNRFQGNFNQNSQANTGSGQTGFQNNFNQNSLANAANGQAGFQGNFNQNSLASTANRQAGFQNNRNNGFASENDRRNTFQNGFQSNFNRNNNNEVSNTGNEEDRRNTFLSGNSAEESLGTVSGSKNSFSSQEETFENSGVRDKVAVNENRVAGGLGSSLSSGKKSSSSFSSTSSSGEIGGNRFGDDNIPASGILNGGSRVSGGSGGGSSSGGSRKSSSSFFSSSSSSSSRGSGGSSNRGSSSRGSSSGSRNSGSSDDRFVDYDDI